MFFFLKYTGRRPVGIGLRQLEEAKPFPAEDELAVQPGKQRLEEFDLPAGRFLLLGDPVWNPATDPLEGVFRGEEVDLDRLFLQVKGHYYWFLLNGGHLRCGTSFGALFPLYYARQGSVGYLCSHAAFLSRQLGTAEPNPLFLLERLLFHYGAFDASWWKGVQLLDAHRYIDLKPEEFRVAGDFELHRYFGEGKNSSAAQLEELVGLFEEETRLFFPKEKPGISWTGGFDGRTLLAVARKNGLPLLPYSFGRPGSSDVEWPRRQARHLRLDYKPILLDEAYLRERALPAALAFQQQSEYCGNLGRPHYQYAASELSSQVNYILTGNFGSELFRALHQPGPMMSEALIRIFSSRDESWKDDLAARVAAWPFQGVNPGFDELISKVEDYLRPMAGWDPNHKFYQFVFSNIFRKYFGPELQVQSHYLNNRTPFLNLRFMQALNQTIWAGVHSRLFEKQKNRRFKGQIFYAALLRQSDPTLYRMMTNKGYRPADVLEPWRFPLLLGGLAYKKLSRQAEEDENAVWAFFRQHYQALGEGLLPAGGGEDWLEHSRQEIAQGRRLPYWLQIYSIFGGWQWASAATEQQQVDEEAKAGHLTK